MELQIAVSSVVINIIGRLVPVDNLQLHVAMDRKGCTVARVLPLTAALIGCNHVLRLAVIANKTMIVLLKGMLVEMEKDVLLEVEHCVVLRIVRRTTEKVLVLRGTSSCF